MQLLSCPVIFYQFLINPISGIQPADSSCKQARAVPGPPFGRCSWKKMCVYYPVRYARLVFQSVLFSGLLISQSVLFPGLFWFRFICFPVYLFPGLFWFRFFCFSPSRLSREDSRQHFRSPEYCRPGYRKPGTYGPDNSPRQK